MVRAQSTLRKHRKKHSPILENALQQAFQQQTVRGASSLGTSRAPKLSLPCLCHSNCARATGAVVISVISQPSKTLVVPSSLRPSPSLRSGDNPCAIVGLGLLAVGDIAVSLGTSDTCLAVLPGLPSPRLAMRGPGEVLFQGRWSTVDCRSCFSPLQAVRIPVACDGKITKPDTVASTQKECTLPNLQFCLL